MKSIDITGVDIKKFIKTAYKFSEPQGLGFLHAMDGDLSDEDAEEIIDNGYDGGFSMDYVHGRSIKMHARKNTDGRILIDDSWYDHSDEQLEQLLAEVGIEWKAREAA